MGFYTWIGSFLILFSLLGIWEVMTGNPEVSGFKATLFLLIGFGFLGLEDLLKSKEE